MTSYNLAQIAKFTSGELFGNSDLSITDLAYDSRNLVKPRSSIFFALVTKKNDGHNYITEAYRKGVRAFVVNKGFSSDLGASFIHVEDTFLALQCLAKNHRKTFKNPIIGITGSNGKTTVKEWLTQVLRAQFTVSSSPRSYNSQLGVPLALWTLNSQSEFGIIEAGISEPNEMHKLAEIIQPDLGIFTHLGDAHLHNFESQEQLIKEKIKLFKGCSNVIIHEKETEVISVLKKENITPFIWGSSAIADVNICVNTHKEHAIFKVNHNGLNIDIKTVLTDQASLENIGHVIASTLQLGLSLEDLSIQIQLLEPLDMRVQVMKGINNCMLINDSYTADTAALENALDLSQKFSFERNKTLIISDFDDGESALNQIKKLISEKDIQRLITIGVHSKKLQSSSTNGQHFKSTSELVDANLEFKNEVIIIKGARFFKLEKIAKRLQLQDHQTVLEINLNAFTENLEFYRKKLKPQTKIMAMVKAFSYGSGSFEVASHLQNLGVDYLAVAYADEGVELRKNGVHMPILVLNPEPSAFDTIIRYQLEPEIYSPSLLDEFLSVLALQGQTKFPIHIKLDTGMHRLGFESDDLSLLLSKLDTDLVEIKSIFSHLAASDAYDKDAFTNSQISLFKEMSEKICAALTYSPLKHICNSSAISRFPSAHFDMVRLGIGLYGISSVPNEQEFLNLAGKLKTKIIQTRTIQKGDSLGYNRSFIAQEETKIGIIPIGYADGLFRSLGHEKINVTIGKQTVPIIGTICMDMAFINLNNTDAKSGTEVIIFQNVNDIKKISIAAETIPYEILSAISHRVKRNFYLE